MFKLSLNSYHARPFNVLVIPYLFLTAMIRREVFYGLKNSI